MDNHNAVDILVEMGFPKDRVDKALQLTGNQGTEPAMEWLLAHSDDPDVDTPLPGRTLHTGATESLTSSPAQEQKADDSMTDSSESNIGSNQQQQLTEEEKAERVKKMEERIRQRRIEREEKEKAEELEKERKRIESGKALIETRRKLEDEEIKRMVEAKKKEKLEEKLARQKVKEQIERDKQARKERAAAASAAVVSPTSPTVAPPPAAAAAPKKTYDQARIQVRLTDGTAVTQTFGVKEQLSSVRLFVQMNRTADDTPFNLMTSFPKRIFTEEDYDKTLDSLGLVPSAVVIVTKAPT